MTLGAFVAILAGGAGPLLAAAGAAGSPHLAKAYGNLPASFEANAGQADRQVEFLSRGAGRHLFLTRGEAVLVLGDGRQPAAQVRMGLAGGARHPRGAGVELQAAKTNYLLGSDRHRWHTGVANYSRVRYRSVYPGIDLVYHGSRRQLEYDFVIAPGADPGRIRLAFRGSPVIGALEVGAQGELILHTASGDPVQPAPAIFVSRGLLSSS